MALGNFKEAVKDFRGVVKVVPKDADARSKLAECEKEFKRREFEKAIASDEVVEDILAKIGNPDDIVLEEEYVGARFDNEITLEFVKAMMEDFKQQKKLHRKFALKIMVKAKEVFTALPSIVDIDVPSDKMITICGDIHGQYYGLLSLTRPASYFRAEWSSISFKHVSL